MFIHLMGKSMYTADTYKFLSTEFDPSENVFVCFRKSRMRDYFLLNDAAKGKAAGCRTVSFWEPSFWKLARQCDGFVIHGLFSFNKILIFAFLPSALKKTNWIVWGGDIYAHNDKNRKLKEKISEKARIMLGPRFGYVTTLVDRDYELAKKWYHVTGKHLNVSYPLPLHQDGVMEKLAKCHDKPLHPLKIMVGNSATESNGHFEVFNLLERYKKEDIQIYLPLSYGQGDYLTYAQRVEKYAICIFGKEKVFSIKEKMSGAEYIEFIKQMNVGIFNNNRQQGMGNINLLIACGAKVYLRNDTTMWEQYVQRGQKLHVCTDIRNESFEEFSREKEWQREINFDAMKRHLDKGGLVKKWSIMFDAMRAQSEQ